MSKLTSTETTLIASRSHRTKLWLSIYQPKNVFLAQVNNPSAAQGDRSIPYDGVLLGLPTDVKDGMTMYVGSALGGSNKGRIRVKSIVTGTVNVAENSYIDWADDDYLTIVDFYEINAKYPRIIADPGDATKTIWYKDYDIEYTNQNTVQGAFPCMGSHFAGFLDDRGYCNVWYTSSGTAHVVSGVNLSYYWSFPGAVWVTGSTSASPGWITYDTPGHYTTQLIVSGSNGSSDISYRHVSVYKRPETVINIKDATAPIPIMEWELDKLSGSHESGGYTASIRILQPIAENIVRDGCLIVIFSDNWYGSTKQSIGGNTENRQDILFTGYVINGSIQFDSNSREITFDVGSPTEIMKKCDSFSVSIEDIDDPAGQAAAHPDYYVSPWTLLAGMNVKKAVHHYLKWHSTVLNCCDLRFMGNTDKLIQYFDADRTSLYSAIQTLLKGAIYGYWGSDRQGCLWAETEYYIESPRNVNGFSIRNQDWVGTPSIDEVLMPEVAYLEAGGIEYHGFTATGTTSIPLLSAAPGISPGYKGTIQRMQGLALDSQAQLNDLTGAVFSYMNRKYPRVSVDMAGNYMFLDVAPEEEFLITVPSDKNPRGIELTFRAFVNQISYSYKPKAESLLVKMSCSHLPSAISASTVAIPPIPPTSGDDGGGFQIPPISIPPIDFGGGGLTEIFVQAVGGFENGSSTSVLIVGSYFDGTLWRQGSGSGGGIILGGAASGLFAMASPHGEGCFVIPQGKYTARITPVILGCAVGEGCYPATVVIEENVYVIGGGSYSATATLQAENGDGLLDTSGLAFTAGGGAGTLVRLVCRRDTANGADNYTFPVFLMGWRVLF